MPYTTGFKWNDDLVSQKILECKDGLKLDRMPSRAEMRNYFGNESLVNRISKTIGFYGWAERLGLQVKDSDTQTGKIGEKFAKEWLESYGFDVKQMPQNYPYDLFVNGCVKIDVKYSNLCRTVSGFSFYSFRLAKDIPTCDIYILITHSHSNTKTFYVVPSREAMQKQISIGENSSVYNRFINRVDIISSYESAFRAVI